MTRLIYVLGLALLLTSLANSAKADLIIDVVGAPGSGQTTWTLTGSDTATSSGTFRSGSLAETDSWMDIADLFKTNISSFQQAISGATVNVGGTAYAIDRILIDDDGSNASNVDDEIGFGVDNTSNVTFSAATLISWTGSFTLGADINDMNVGSYQDPSPSFGGLDLRVNVSAVPEPSGTVLICFALASWNLRFRRTK